MVFYNIFIEHINKYDLLEEEKELLYEIIIIYKKHVKKQDIFFHDLVFLYYDNLVMLQKILNIFVKLDINMNICDIEERNIIHKLILFMNKKNKNKIQACINMLIKYKIDYNKKDIYNKTCGDYEKYIIRSRL